MKRKRDIEMRAVYAGPEFFAKKAREQRNGGEYPNNYLEDDTDTEINDVYGGPGMMGELGEDDTPIEAVYAGPEPEPEPPMGKVYAGPGPVWSRPEDKKPERDDGSMMKGVYACPPLPRRNENDGAPNRPPMMLVYAAPAIRPGAGPGMAKPLQPIRPGENRFCPECGTKVGESANYCQNCGVKLPKGWLDARNIWEGNAPEGTDKKPGEDKGKPMREPPRNTLI